MFWANQNRNFHREEITSISHFQFLWLWSILMGLSFSTLSWQQYFYILFYSIFWPCFCGDFKFQTKIITASLMFLFFPKKFVTYSGEFYKEFHNPIKRYLLYVEDFACKLVLILITAFFFLPSFLVRQKWPFS